MLNIIETLFAPIASCTAKREIRCRAPWFIFPWVYPPTNEANKWMLRHAAKHDVGVAHTDLIKCHPAKSESGRERAVTNPAHCQLDSFGALCFRRLIN